MTSRRNPPASGDAPGETSGSVAADRGSEVATVPPPPPAGDEERDVLARGNRRRSSRSSRRWRSAGERAAITLGASALVAGALWLTYQFVEPAPPDSLRIASGAPGGAYHRFAEELAREFAAEGITLEVVESAGSIDNLARLRAREVDIAFVQSGLANAAEYPRLEGLASLYYEPLWVFSTREPRPERIADLRGLRVAVGPAGSGTRRVALQLLEANGIEPDELTLRPDSADAATKALLDGSIDAALTISSAEAAMVKTLLDADGVTLMNFTRAEAYARRYPFFTALTLPAGVIDFERDIPARDITLVAAAATLVAQRSLHPALADLSMQAAGRVFAGTTLFSAAGRFPAPDYVDFPLSDEATRYYSYGVPFLQRYLPFWAATLVDRLKLLALPLIALLLPLSRLLPPAYRWSVRKKVYRWYAEVQSIDHLAGDDPRRATLERCLIDLGRIEDEAREVTVPLAYAHELYALRQHIDLLSQQIERRLSPGRSPPVG